MSKEVSKSSSDLSDDSSDYESDSSSSNDEQVMLKPVFISKSQRSKAKEDTLDKAENDDRKKEITLSKVEQRIKLRTREAPNKDEFDGIDDTDDLDPEKEYKGWKARELARYQRDREVLRQEEQAKEERLRRENLTEQELIEAFEKRKVEIVEIKGNDSNTKGYYKGAFFQDDDIRNKFLKRDYTQVDEEDRVQH